MVNPVSSSLSVQSFGSKTSRPEHKGSFTGQPDTCHLKSPSGELLQVYFLGKKAKKIQTVTVESQVSKASYNNALKKVAPQLKLSKSWPQVAEVTIKDKDTNLKCEIWKKPEEDQMTVNILSGSIAGENVEKFKATVQKDGQAKIELTENQEASSKEEALKKVLQSISGNGDIKVKAKYELLDRAKLHEALRKMGPDYLKEPYKSMWTPEVPALGYCYIVSEVLYHKFAPEGSKPARIRFGPESTHWWVKTPEGHILDMTGEQFDGQKLRVYDAKTKTYGDTVYDTIPYHEGTNGGFLTKDPSARARTLAEHLGIEF